MTEARRQIPRQPKLRASCDECGAAKLKCDRGQPQCGRCMSLGLTCVYGVSRKMGKPPREKPRVGSEAPRTAPVFSEHPASHDRDTHNSWLPASNADDLGGESRFEP